MRVYIAKGSVGGGSRSSSSSSRSSSTPKSSAPKTSTPAPKSSSSSSTPKATTPAKPAAPKTSAKAGTSKATPGSKVKTTDGKEVQSSAKKPTTSKKVESKGIVGDNGYTPRFTNGYSAPAGSVVYYPQHSAFDYLPWIYLFSLGNDSPREDKTIIVQPDGKEVEAQPVREGADGMAIFNWFLLIVIVAAIIGGIVWAVNRKTSK